MTNTLSSIEVQALGPVGLFLMVVIARLANHAYESQHTVKARTTSFLARRAIDGIAAIGWLADHLPPAPPRYEQRTFQRAR